MMPNTVMSGVFDLIMVLERPKQRHLGTRHLLPIKEMLSTNVLCYFFCHGEGIPIDLIEAEQYFKLAADANNADAQMILGIFHFIGIGCCVDLAAANVLFRTAADQGKPMVNSNLLLPIFSTSNQIVIVRIFQDI
jgi:hypothetical protein